MGQEQGWLLFPHIRTKSKTMNMEKQFSNDLSEAEIERLALLVEEAAEVQQIAMKILRHGYLSFNPSDITMTTNRELLTRELGDLRFAAELMIKRGDINTGEIIGWSQEKSKKIKKYLHHNTVDFI